MADVAQNKQAESNEYISFDNELQVLVASDRKTKFSAHKKLLVANSQHYARHRDYEEFFVRVGTAAALNAYLNWVYRKAIPQLEQASAFGLETLSSGQENFIELAEMYRTAAWFEDRGCQDAVIDAVVELARHIPSSGRHKLPGQDTIERMYIARDKDYDNAENGVKVILAIYADLATPTAMGEIDHKKFSNELACLLLGRARMGETKPLLADICSFHVHEVGKCRSKKRKRDEGEGE